MNKNRTDIDSLIKELIKELNQNGFKTKSSCQGDSEDFSYIIFSYPSQAFEAYYWFSKVLVLLDWQDDYRVALSQKLHPESHFKLPTKRILKWDKGLTYNKERWPVFLEFFFKALVNHKTNKSYPAPLKNRE